MQFKKILLQVQKWSLESKKMMILLTATRAWKQSAICIVASAGGGDFRGGKHRPPLLKSYPLLTFPGHIDWRFLFNILGRSVSCLISGKKSPLVTVEETKTFEIFVTTQSKLKL